MQITLVDTIIAISYTLLSNAVHYSFLTFYRKSSCFLDNVGLTMLTISIQVWRIVCSHCGDILRIGHSYEPNGLTSVPVVLSY